jgi:hypothetical protein
MDTPAGLSPEEFKQLFSLAKRVLWTNHDTRRRLQGKAINIVPANFYSEIPTHDELETSFEYAEELPFDSPMFDPKPLEAFAREHLAPYAPEFNPPKDNPHAPEIKEFFWSCPAFSSTDAIAYYTMIRNLKPKRILEIGSGYSTLVALEAVRQNGFGEVICIEPFPRDWIRALPIELIEQKVQTLDSQFFQEQLDDGDILFIDSTHTVKNGTDVLHLYLRVLPFLTRKLAVHVHDIYLPYPLPLALPLCHRDTDLLDRTVSALCLSAGQSEDPPALVWRSGNQRLSGHFEGDDGRKDTNRRVLDLVLSQ